MVTIGRAVMFNPWVLLCDKISRGLASVVICGIGFVLPRIKQASASVVLVGQDVGQAMKLADHFYCMLEGRVTLSAPPGDLRRAAIHDACFGAHA